MSAIGDNAKIGRAWSAQRNGLEIIGSTGVVLARMLPLIDKYVNA